jgi:hypothetical protein
MASPARNTDGFTCAKAVPPGWRQSPVVATLGVAMTGQAGEGHGWLHLRERKTPVAYQMPLEPRRMS